MFFCTRLSGVVRSRCFGVPLTPIPKPHSSNPIPKPNPLNPDALNLRNNVPLPQGEMVVQGEEGSLRLRGQVSGELGRPRSFFFFFFLGGGGGVQWALVGLKLREIV